MRKARVLAFVSLALVLGASTLPVLGQEYPEGMIAYWKLDEGAGTAAGDTLGTYDGVLFGATWVDGQVGGALSFDGNDWVELPVAAAEFRVDMSWELWMQSSMDPAHKIVWFTRLNEPGNPDLTCCYWGLFYAPFDQHYLEFVVAKPPATDYSNLNTGAHYLDGEWHHLAVTKDNTYIRFYVDGALVADYDNPALDQWETYPTYHYVGRPDGSVTPRAFSGMMDELALYDRVLTPDEIRTHYQNGLEGRGYELAPTMVPALSRWGFIGLGALLSLGLACTLAVRRQRTAMI